MALKNWLGILILVLTLFFVVSVQVASASTEDILFEVLPADSESVGSFVANRCRMGQYWIESDKWTSVPFWGSEVIGLGYITNYGNCEDAYIVFSAKEGYAWKYYSGWFGKGYYLKKD